MRKRATFLSLAALCAPSGNQGYAPQLPSSFAAAVTNRYFPLIPGTALTYAGGGETNTVEVLSTTRLVHGVVATVVRDRVFVNGSLIEETFDWYAQDPAGNVWYLGEDSKEYRKGELISTAGSWEWGKGGALPGIIMWSDPGAHLGAGYRQEYLKGEAEDWGKVVALNQSVKVPFGRRDDCVKIEEWSPLEPGRGYKFYCPGIGMMLETSQSGGERSRLTSRTP